MATKTSQQFFEDIQKNTGTASNSHNLIISFSTKSKSVFIFLILLFEMMSLAQIDEKIVIHQKLKDEIVNSMSENDLAAVKLSKMRAKSMNVDSARIIVDLFIETQRRIDEQCVAYLAYQIGILNELYEQRAEAIKMEADKLPIASRTRALWVMSCREN
jgi:hypothetical protein